jgi:hypothetical protein
VTAPDPRRRTRLALIIALAAAVVLGGLALVFLGIGAELDEERDVFLKVEVTELREDIAEQIRVGDPVFTDAGGMLVGEIVEVDVAPSREAVPDAEGRLNDAENPVEWTAIVVIQATGREGAGIVAIDNEVVQAGRPYNVISRSYYLPGTVVNVDVR